ncbi:hypothetical protein BKA69DRAFT_1036848 [Paraphysoderma sedebokerense]|nr:hypothetical protein BKA69DRAFT_1036848 [Paraphysoderma sedebokerense]
MHPFATPSRSTSSSRRNQRSPSTPRTTDSPFFVRRPSFSTAKKPSSFSQAKFTNVQQSPTTKLPARAQTEKKVPFRNALEWNVDENVPGPDENDKENVQVNTQHLNSGSQTNDKGLKQLHKVITQLRQENFDLKLKCYHRDGMNMSNDTQTKEISTLSEQIKTTSSKNVPSITISRSNTQTSQFTSTILTDRPVSHSIPHSQLDPQDSLILPSAPDTSLISLLNLTEDGFYIDDPVNDSFSTVDVNDSEKDIQATPKPRRTRDGCLESSEIDGQAEIGNSSKPNESVAGMEITEKHHEPMISSRQPVKQEKKVLLLPDPLALLGLK